MMLIGTLLTSFHSEIQAAEEVFTWDMVFLWPRKNNWAAADTPQC